MPGITNSIVVINHNNRKALRTVLGALKMHEAMACEILVVDNSSFDGSAEMVRAEFGAVQVIEAKKNRGFAAGANLGFREARGDVIVFCHSDVITTTHVLTELADQVREGQSRRVAAALPRLIGRDGEEIPFIGRLPGLARGMMGVFNPSSARRCALPQLDHLADHEWASMCCIAIRADILQSLGGFDPRFFLYYADTDLCLRLHERSWRILIRPNLKVIHAGRSPNEKPPPGLTQIMRKDQQRYFEKHRPKWEQGMLRVDTKIHKLLKRESA